MTESSCGEMVPVPRKAEWRNKIIINKNRGYIYFPVPKVACTSIKAWIAVDMGLSNEYIHEIHFPVISLDEASLKSNYLRFAFVRNPWDRILSCYLDKVRREPINNPFFKNGLHNGFVSRHPGRFKAGMSFDAFLDEVSGINDDMATDPHLLSQHFLLSDIDGKLVANFIGRFERLEQDSKILSERLGLSEVLPHLNRSWREQKYSDYYTPRMRDIVAKRYEKDIQLFQYEF